MTRKTTLWVSLAAMALFLYGCPPPHRHPPRHHPVPTCLTLDPTVGPHTGGTEVIIETRGFSDDFTVEEPDVYFGGIPALDVIPLGPRSIKAITPPDAMPSPGGYHVVDVVVAGQSGDECRFPDGFKYEGPSGPACLELAPKGGHCDGGTIVEIHTRGFSDDFTQFAPEVYFDGVPALEIDVIDSDSSSPLFFRHQYFASA